jgi:prevent-host-death family protein
MRSVNVAELKNSLSSYLRLVRDGEELIVRDRNRPIARIVPIASEEPEDDEEARLIASGQLTPGGGPIGEEFWAMPAPKVSAKAVQRALEAERDGW